MRISPSANGGTETERKCCYTLPKPSWAGLLVQPPSRPSAAARPRLPLLNAGKAGPREGNPGAARTTTTGVLQVEAGLPVLCPVYSGCTGWRGSADSRADSGETRGAEIFGGRWEGLGFPLFLTGFRDWAQSLEVGGCDIGEVVTYWKAPSQSGAILAFSPQEADRAA